MIRLELPFPPSANSIWQGNRQGKVFKSPKYKEWLDEAGWLVKQQTRKMVLGPYVLQVQAVRPDKRRRDFDNLLKASSDLLTRLNVIEDDSLCKAIAAEWVDDGPPITLIVYSLEDQTWKIPNLYLN